MSQRLESGMAAGGHLHGAISLAPPALCEAGPPSNTAEEFDFLAPQRRIRRFAAVGGMSMVLGALGLVGLLGSHDVAGREASARASEPTLNSASATPHLTAATDRQVQPASVRAEAQSSAPATSPALLATASEAAPRRAARPVARVSAKAKRGARKR